jgi:phosphoribosylformylglycinamidine synthase subunit PurQ / glutaminase
LRMPIAHGEGRYFADSDTLAELEAEGRIVFRYCTPDGGVTPEANPNGSVENIAGVVNKRGNVLGLMPHPERASEAVMGGEDGLFVWRSMLAAAIATAA